MDPSAAALALAGLNQVKHPNFGGFSQGIEIGLAAFAFPILGPLLAVSSTHGCGIDVTIGGTPGNWRTVPGTNIKWVLGPYDFLDVLVKGRGDNRPFFHGNSE